MILNMQKIVEEISSLGNSMELVTHPQLLLDRLKEMEVWKKKILEI